MPRILIDLGQSNQQGHGIFTDMSTQYKQTLPQVKMWDGSTFASLDYTVNNNQFPLSERTNEGNGTFARSVALSNYFGETVYCIPYEVGGTWLALEAPTTLSWNIAYEGRLYDQAMYEINKAFIYLWNTLLLRGDCHIYWFWDQGEGDSGMASKYSAYQTNLTNFINKLRTNLSGVCVKKNVFVINLTDPLVGVGLTNRNITGASNTTPIVITTQTAHDTGTGLSVEITGVTGNTAANGTFTVTSLNATQFSLDASVGNGNYISGGLVNYFPGVPTVNAAKSAVASSLSNVYTIQNVWEYSADKKHLTMAGYEAKGQAEADVIINNNL